MVNITRMLLVTGGLLVISMTAYADLPQVGEMPVPVVKNVSVDTDASYDTGSQVYTYQYTVSNPSSNTGGIGDIRVEMTAPAEYRAPSYNANLTIPSGASGNVAFASVASGTPMSLPHGDTIIPFGQQMPSDWMGQLTAGGEADFFSVGSGDSGDVQPGQKTGGFVLISPGLPTIKMMTLQPDWELMTPGEATEQEEKTAAQVEQALTIRLPVLAPSAAYPGSPDQWDQFRDDITRAIQLGWISDSAFGQQVLSDLAAARAAFDNEGPAYIQKPLTALLNAIETSTNAQRNAMAYKLLLLNTQALLSSALQQGSEPPEKQASPKYTFITPDPQTLPVDHTVTVTAKVVDQGSDDAPIVGMSIRLYVDGVNSGKSIVGTTNKLGEISLTYKGTLVGTDVIHMGSPIQLFAATASPNSSPPDITSTVIWRGGPDLTLKYFTPPVIRWRGTGTIHIEDGTENIGNTPASEPTVTRYYVSSTHPVVPASSEVVGERTVPPLPPGAVNDNGGMDLPLPSNLAAGTYFLMACVNATRTVGETNYQNNCKTNEVVMVLHHAPPPDCSQAAPSVGALWPPNHKMVNIKIDGVSDPNNYPFKMTITGIKQDEPVNGLGDGDKSPDGVGVGTSTASVRAERSGTGDGRLYFISFKAVNSVGGMCTGTVQVGVPHDQGQQSTPVDTGKRYDSTATK